MSDGSDVGAGYVHAQVLGNIENIINTSVIPLNPAGLRSSL